jgi:hypothetical protein
LALPELIVATRKMAAFVSVLSTACGVGGKPVSELVAVNQPHSSFRAASAITAATSLACVS